MSSEFPTLPTSPLPHTAMDYAALRAEGLAMLGKLSGGQWTDFNVHDPGITLLELLCYAITDLGYRANFPMADLLADSTEPGLPGPEQILPGDPVTDTDLREAVLDLGVGAVRVQGPSDTTLPFYHHASSGELRLVVDPGAPDTSPVRLRGLHRVLVQTSDILSGDGALRSVAARVHRGRLLGEDHEIALLDTVDVKVTASIEVGAVDDPVGLLADIVEQIQRYLAPPVRFYTRAELSDLRPDVLYAGPRLDHGFVLNLPQTRDTVYASDLLHTILDVPKVRAVRSIALAGATGGTRDPWIVRLPTNAVARLASDSKITLMRAGLPLRIDSSKLFECLERRRTAHATALRVEPSSQRSAGTSRGLDRYHSVQRQLPAAYGIGTLGLPQSATVERQAQALQLQAYLLLFDQLLQNALAQLAHAHTLFSPNDGGARTYFARPIQDPPLDLAALIRLSPAKFSAWLDTAVETGDPLERRKRFLAHLLARFAEELGDQALIDPAFSQAPDAEIVARRQAFLADIARVGASRGSGYDLGTLERGGFDARLRIKLGSAWPFLVIEHVLLRPVPEDRGQLVDEGEEQLPLLAGVSAADPWSLQVSFIFNEHEATPELENFEQLVAQTLLAEVPAHLSPRLRWFGAADGLDHWALMQTAWSDFQVKLQNYRAATLGGASASTGLQLSFRDARDRVVDLLQIGRTWPLRDIPLPDHLIVAPGDATEVVLGFSQRGVQYELRHRDTGEPIQHNGAPIVAEGSGGVLVLPTPPIVDDVNYRVLAVKLEDKDKPELRRQTWLRGVIRVEEGVDPRLVAQIRLPLLDGRADDARPEDARIANYGVAVEVEILLSQEGVVYELIDDVNWETPFDPQTPTISEASVVGTSGTIVLRLPKVTEDLDVRIRGSKNVGDPQNPQLRTAILDTVLPLRVRANPLAEAALVPPIIDYGAIGRIEVRTSQRSVSYQGWTRATRDAEFVFEAQPAVEVIVVSDGDRKIQVARPTRTDTPASIGFTANSETKSGNGQKIGLAYGPIDRDILILVLATKQHLFGPLRGADARTITSSVALERAMHQLNRPDPAAPLRVRVRIDAAGTIGPWQLFDGQAGVYYTIRSASANLGFPAYFHQRDDQNAQRNKGVGQLRVQIDLAIANDAPLTGLRTEQAPPPPTLEEPGVGVGTAFVVVARKAMSGLEAPMSAALVLTAPVAVRAEPAKVAAGAAAKVLVASAVGERYTLTRDGVAVGQPQDGSGAELAFDTGAVSTKTLFELLIARPDAIALDRLVQVTVEV